MKRLTFRTLVVIAWVGFLGLTAIAFAESAILGFGVMLVVGGFGATYPGFHERGSDDQGRG